jgi:hypothetical protein
VKSTVFSEDTKQEFHDENIIQNVTLHKYFIIGHSYFEEKSTELTLKSGFIKSEGKSGMITFSVGNNITSKNL